MITKIISGGQTGVDRAALDAALNFGLDCGGWCPLGRLAEDGVIPNRYPLKETPSSTYSERTQWNVRDSDGTLILSWGAPTGGTAETIVFAKKLDKPCKIVDLLDPPAQESVVSWIDEHSIRVLNVAGPRASKNSEVHKRALEFVERLLGKFKPPSQE